MRRERLHAEGGDRPTIRVDEHLIAAGTLRPLHAGDNRLQIVEIELRNSSFDARGKDPNGPIVETTDDEREIGHDRHAADLTLVNLDFPGLRLAVTVGVDPDE